MELLRTQKKRNKMRDLGKVRRRKITIRKMTTYQDEWENQKRDWVDWRTLWAERSSLWGQEYYQAKTVNESNTVEFTVRHVAFLEEVDTVNYQIVFDGREYDITHIDHLSDDGMWIKFKCLERDSRGD